MNIETLCWRCGNAVPSADGTRGCPWSTVGRPVEGWSAIRRDIRFQRSKQKKDQPGKRLESYLVVECPQFLAERRGAVHG